VVECETQEEIDYYWDKLSAVPEAEQCGWLKDQFGVSWQIVPNILGKLMSDPSKSDRVLQAFLKMKKFEIDKLINA
jgi:predicted 3-demethylubiquinone-9 3-methyltransferase (glyoxalase superfamily)